MAKHQSAITVIAVVLCGINDAMVAQVHILRYTRRDMQSQLDHFGGRSGPFLAKQVPRRAPGAEGHRLIDEGLQTH